MRGLRVGIVGGSLGGLTAALTLRDVGCEVEVFERSTAELEARGAGIAVLDETTRWFRERTDLDVDEITTSTSWLRYLRPSGSVAFEKEQFSRFSSWNRIYRELLHHFGGAHYHLGATMTSVDQAPGAASITFDDGTTRTFDLVVCVDGISSTARPQLVPDADAHYAGYVAWRGTVPESALTPTTFERLADAITYQVVPDSHILVYPIPSVEGDLAVGARLQNFVWYRNVAPGAPLEDLLRGSDGRQHTTSLPPGAARDEHVVEMRETTRALLAPPIAEVVLKSGDPFLQVIYDIQVPQMVFGRVVLMGDAAFAVRPHVAAGTAKAAADGWALAEALARAEDEDESLDDALLDFERRQLGLGLQLLTRARAIGSRSQVDNTWDPGDPGLTFGLYGPGR